MKFDKEILKEKTNNLIDKTKSVTVNTKEKSVEIAKKATENLNDSKEKLIKSMDQNGDGTHLVQSPSRFPWFDHGKN